MLSWMFLLALIAVLAVIYFDFYRIRKAGPAARNSGTQKERITGPFYDTITQTCSTYVSRNVRR